MGCSNSTPAEAIEDEFRVVHTPPPLLICDDVQPTRNSNQPIQLKVKRHLSKYGDGQNIYNFDDAEHRGNDDNKIATAMQLTSIPTDVALDRGDEPHSYVARSKKHANNVVAVLENIPRNTSANKNHLFKVFTFRPFTAEQDAAKKHPNGKSLYEWAVIEEHGSATEPVWYTVKTSDGIKYNAKRVPPYMGVFQL